MSTSLAAVVGGTIVGIVLILRALRPGRKRRFHIHVEWDSDDHDSQPPDQQAEGRDQSP